MVQRIKSIEIGRGLAAVAVALMHAGTGMAPDQYSGHVGFGGLFDFGRYGVDFFFVLSGYIILKVSELESPGATNVRDFCIKRFFRIIPAYWVILVFSLIVNLFQRDRAAISIEWLILQFTLFDSRLFVSAAWTLQFEFLFYMLCAIMIWNLRFGLMILLFWIALIIHRAFFGIGGISHAGIYEVISNPYCLLFFQGGLSYLLMEKSSRALVYSLVLLFAAALLFFLAAVSADLNYYELTHRLLIGSLFVVALIVAVRFEMLSRFDSKLLAGLGKISYSVYLSNVLLIGLVYAILERLGLYQKLEEPSVAIIAIAATIGFSYCLYKFVENPGIKIGNKIIEIIENKSARG
jgi:exopolysaccharide production protein ExoZ